MFACSGRLLSFLDVAPESRMRGWRLQRTLAVTTGPLSAVPTGRDAAHAPDPRSSQPSYRRVRGVLERKPANRSELAEEVRPVTNGALQVFARLQWFPEWMRGSERKAAQRCEPERNWRRRCDSVQAVSRLEPWRVSPFSRLNARLPRCKTP